MQIFTYLLKLGYMNRPLYLTFAALLTAMTLQAQTATTTIVEHLQSASGGRVTVTQPERLGERLNPQNGNPENGSKAANKNRVGYRIQIFADNNQRTAKNEAVARERNVSARFPDLGCYLSYKAPTWRMRVGDFATREEAVEMMQQLKKEFPSYAREMIVVVDRINVTL